MTTYRHNKAPAYQWYPKDYDTDEAVKLMTYEEEGIYRRLLDHQALHGSIPAEPIQIARLVPKIPAARFLKLWPAIAGKFTLVDGRLLNRRLERAQREWDAFINRQRTAGRRSVESRRQKFGTAQPNQPPNDNPNQSPNDVRTKIQTNDRTSPEAASATAVQNLKDRDRTVAHATEPPVAEKVCDAYRAHWKRLYGYESTLLLKPLEYMQLEQQIQKCGERRLLAALDAYFASTDTFVRGAKHPLALFLKDPAKYLAQEPRSAPERPARCKHDPPCADDAEHTRRDMADRKARAAS